MGELTEKQQQQLDAWFKYHPPTPDDVPRFNAITEAAAAFARVVMTNTPPCADQSAALRLVREARMTANAAIACKGI